MWYDSNSIVSILGYIGWIFFFSIWRLAAGQHPSLLLDQ